MGIVPPSRPGIARDTALAWAGTVTDKVYLVGRRGYYRDTMGKPGTNDRGLFDDAIVLVTPDACLTFNANTDPSVFREHIATLTPGRWRVKPGTHHPGTPGAYRCLVQAGPVTVRRDGGVEESGEFYIHIHRGGVNGTSSLGCQTIPPGQWPDFMRAVDAALVKYGQRSLLYILTERGDA